VRGTLEHGGAARSFYVHLPKGHDESNPAPLVIALHGGGGRGAKFDASTLGQTTREADRRGWVVVYPDGLEKGWDDGRPLDSPRDRRRGNPDDVGFLSALIDRMHSDYGIDRTRVYAMGISNGGFMSFRLGIELSERIAAIAPVTANLSLALEPQKPARAVPVLVMNGTEDPLVPYGGGQVRVLGKSRGEILSTAKTIDWWVANNGCTPPPAKKTLPDTATDDGATVEVESYTACRDSSEVVLYRIRGGGHTWPGGMQYLPESVIGRVCRDIDGTEKIFDFFARHRLRPSSSTSPTATGASSASAPATSATKASCPERKDPTKLLWRNDDLELELARDAIRCLTDAERAAVGYVASVVGSSCDWVQRPDAYGAGGRMRCMLTAALGLGDQCAAPHEDFIESWLGDDAPAHCWRIPITAYAQAALDEVTLRRDEAAITVAFKATGTTGPGGRAWSWSETLRFEPHGPKALALVHRGVQGKPF
jgi:polyhydroxybutyrate depolymerase